MIGMLLLTALAALFCYAMIRAMKGRKDIWVMIALWVAFVAGCWWSYFRDAF